MAPRWWRRAWAPPRQRRRRPLQRERTPTRGATVTAAVAAAVAVAVLSGAPREVAAAWPVTPWSFNLAAAGNASLPIGGVSVSVGATHACAVFADMTLKCWGVLGGVLLANDAASAPLVPAPAARGGGLLTVYQVTSTARGVCAVSRAREAWCWGDCTTGVCGLGMAAAYPSLSAPLAPVDFGTARVAAMAGHGSGNFVCALTTVGAVYCWGDGGSGQLGRGSTARVGVSDTPWVVGPAQMPTGVEAVGVAAGSGHACIVSSARAVYCWGANSRGQLGVGSTTSQSTSSSATAVAVGAPAVAVVAGAEHTCALTAAGNVVCWGRASEGQLGLSNTNDVGTGIVAVGSATALGNGLSAVQLSAGAYHTCAVLTGGVPGMAAVGTAWQVGGLLCWGSNAGGRLGLNTSTAAVGDNEAATAYGYVDVGITARVTEVAAGWNSTCAVLQERNLLCWGATDGRATGHAAARLAAHAQYTAPYLGDDETPAVVGPVDVGSPYRLAMHAGTAYALDLWNMGFLPHQLSVGLQHTCYIDGGDGAAYCMGTNNDGRLGWGNTATWPTSIGSTPLTFGSGARVQLPDGRPAVAVAVGRNVSCFILDDRRLACAGSNAACLVANATTLPPPVGAAFPTPTLVDLGANMTALSVAVGLEHICVLRADARVMCWGHNDVAQLGLAPYGIATRAAEWRCVPAAVPPVSLGGTSNKAVAVVVGAAFSAAVRADDGRVVVWGSNAANQRASATSNDGNPGATSAAIGDGTAGYSVARIAAGRNHWCVIFTTGYGTCVGGNNAGQIGIGSTADTTYGNPTAWSISVNQPPGSVNLAVAAGDDHSFFLFQNGVLYAAGANTHGEVVAPASASVTTFTAANIGNGLQPWCALPAGASAQHSFLINNRGLAGPWGRNDVNQCGSGGTADLPAPPAIGNTLRIPSRSVIGVLQPYVTDVRGAPVRPPAGMLVVDVSAERVGPPNPALNVYIVGGSTAVTCPNVTWPAAGAWGSVLRCTIAAAALPTAPYKVGVSRTHLDTDMALYTSAVVVVGAPVLSALLPNQLGASGLSVTATGSAFPTGSTTAPVLSVGGVAGGVGSSLSATAAAVSAPGGVSSVGGEVSISFNGTLNSSACTLPAACVVGFAPPRINAILPATQLRVGQVVNVTGSGFGALPRWDTNVTVGTLTRCNYTWVSEWLLLLVIPAGITLNVPVTVYVAGQASNSNVTVSVQQPVVYAITPPFAFTGNDSSVVATFFITGFNMGVVSGDVTVVRVGGTTCPTFTWYNSSTLSCNAIPTHAWSGNSVEVVWGAIASPPNTLFTYYGVPTLSSVQPTLGTPSTPITLAGTNLGVSTFTDVYRITVGGVTCTDLTTLAQNVLQCKVPSGAGRVDVVVYLTNGPPAVMRAAFTYSVSYVMTPAWTTPNASLVVVPSSPIAPVNLPAPVVLTLDDGYNGTAITDASPAQCYLSIAAAVNPAKATAAAASQLVGVTSVTAVLAGKLWVATWTVGVQAPPDTLVYLAASCSAIGAPQAGTGTPLVVYVAALALAWAPAPALSGVAPSISSSDIDALAPAPAVALLASAVFRGGTAGAMRAVNVSSSATVTCLMSRDGASDTSVAVIGTTGVAVNASGVAVFTRVGVQGALAASLQLSVTCTWYTGDQVSLMSAPGRLLDAALTPTAAALPATLLYASTLATPVDLRLLPVNTTGGALPSPPLPWLSNVTCSFTSADVTGVAVVQGGGAAYNASRGMVTLTDLRLSPVSVDAAAYPAVVTLTLTCSIRLQPMSRVATLTTAVTLPRLAWRTPPPSVAIPCASRYPVPGVGDLAVAVVDDTGKNMTADNTTTCTLTSTLVSSPDGLGSASLVPATGGVTVKTVAGVATWRDVALVAPLGAVVTAFATCKRAAGGPDLVINATITAAEARVGWATLGSRGDPATLPLAALPPLLHATGYPATVRVNFTHPGTGATLAGYNATAYGAAACTARVADASADVGSLGGGGAATGALSATGTAAVTLYLSADAGRLVTLQVDCSLLGSTRSTPGWNTSVDAVAAVWVTAPPVVVLPSSSRALFVVAGNLSVAVRDSSGRVLSADNTTSCTLAPVLVSAPDGGGSVSVVPAAGTGAVTTKVSLGVAVWRNVAVVAPLGGVLQVTATCKRAEGGVELTTGVANVTCADARVVWATLGAGGAPANTPPAALPPVLYNTGYPVGLRVEWVHPATGAVLGALNASAAGGASCTVRVADASASVASLGGGGAGTGSVGGGGGVNVSVYLQADAGVGVGLQVDCSLLGSSRTSAAWNTSVSAVNAAWVTALPSYTTASARALPVAILPTATLQLLDGSGGRLTGDTTSRCSLAAAPAVATDGTAVAVLLGSAATAVVNGGLATWSALALATTPGALINLTATCTRTAGGPSAAVTTTVRLADAVVNLTGYGSGGAASPSGAPPPLYGTAYPITGRVSWAAANGSAAGGTAYEPVTWGAVQCSLRVGDAWAGVASLVGPSGAATGGVGAGGAFSLAVYLAAPERVAVGLVVDCSVLGATRTSAVFNLTLLPAAAVWLAAPPPTALPSTRAIPVPIAPALSVALHDGAGSLLASDTTTRCTLAVAPVSPADDPTFLTALVSASGVTTATAVGGVATWAAPALAGVFGATVTVTATCSRAEGGAAVVVAANVSLAAVAVSWGAVGGGAPAAPANPPPLYYATGYPLVAAVTVSGVPYNATTSGPVTCTLRLADGAPPGAALTGDARATTSTVAPGGNVTVSAILAASPGVPVPLVLDCTVLGVTVSSASLPVQVTPQHLEWTTRPPAYLYPSTSSHLAAMSPPPAVAIVDGRGDVVASDITTKCSMTVETVGGAGGVLAQLLGGGAGRATAVAAGRVAFADTGVVAALGARVAMNVTCTRAAGDTLGPLTATVALASVAVVWVAPPPAYLLAATRFPVAVALLSVDADGALGPPYDVAVGGAATCALELVAGASSPDAAIIGTSAENSGAVGGPNATAAMKVVVRAPPDAAVTLTAACTVLSTSLTAPPVTAVMERLRTWWDPAAPPRPMVLPWSPGAPAATSTAIVRMDAASGNTVDWSATVCRLTVNASATGYVGDAADAPVLAQAPVDGYAYDGGVRGVPLTGVQLSAGWGVTAVLDVRCARVDGDDLPPLVWVLAAGVEGVRWEVPPPATMPALSPWRLVVELVDAGTGPGRGARVAEDNVTNCRVAVEPSVPLTGADLSTAAGLATTPAFTLSGRPGATYRLAPVCTRGTRAFLGGGDAAAVNVTIDGCATGAAPMPPANTTCVTCGDGSYSDGGSAPCTRCPRSDGVVCTDGRATLLPGYYLANVPYLPPAALGLRVAGDGGSGNSSVVYDPDAVAAVLTSLGPGTELVACVNPAACTVDSATRTYACAAGHSGVMCAVCRHDLRYARNGDGCSRCSSPLTNWILLGCAAAVATVALFYIALFLRFRQASERRVVWRIAVNFLTALTSLGIFTARGTATFRAVFGFMTAAVAPGSGVMDLAPVACELAPSYYTKYYAVMLLPALVAAAAVIINLINIVRLHALRGWQPLHAALGVFWRERKWVSVTMVVLALTYPALTSNAFSVFACSATRIDGVRYLRGDYAVPCGDGTHTLAVMVAYLAVAFLVVGFPAGFTAWLVRNEKRVRAAERDPVFFSGFGFLFAGYKNDAWYNYSWEAVVMLRKAGIVLIGSILTDGYLQVMASQILVLVALFAQLAFKPYTTREFNYLDAASLLCLSATQAGSLAYLRSQAVREQVASSSGSLTADEAAALSAGLIDDTTTTALLVTLNAAMIGALILMYIRSRLRDAAAAKGAASRFAVISKLLAVRKAAATRGEGGAGVPSSAGGAAVQLAAYRSHAVAADALAHKSHLRSLLPPAAAGGEDDGGDAKRVPAGADEFVAANPLAVARTRATFATTPIGGGSDTGGGGGGGDGGGGARRQSRNWSALRKAVLDPVATPLAPPPST